MMPASFVVYGVNSSSGEVGIGKLYGASYGRVRGTGVRLSGRPRERDRPGRQIDALRDGTSLSLSVRTKLPDSPCPFFPFPFPFPLILSTMRK